MTTVNSAVFQLLNKIVSTSNIEKCLNESANHWKDSHFAFVEIKPDDVEGYYFDFALSELDKDYLNLFFIPYLKSDGSSSESRDLYDTWKDSDDSDDSDDSGEYKVLAAYKLGGICLSTGEIYIKDSPWGIDTYEDRNVVSQFRITKSYYQQDVASAEQQN
jgi:hypothetical protein